MPLSGEKWSSGSDRGVLSPGNLEHIPISFVFSFLACRVETAISMGSFEHLQVRHVVDACHPST